MQAAILAPDSELFRRLHWAAVESRCVFFAGLPGVGKSLLLQQTSLIAREAGRRVSLLQWDVARGAFETPEILGRYPDVDGVTHAAIRKAAGLWARGTVGAWDQTHPDRANILIGEVPLVGSRLIELVQRHEDAVDMLLAGKDTVFFIPVPSREVREVIEAARVREMASPGHEREQANALPHLVQGLWDEVAVVAGALGIESGGLASGPGLTFDPDLYAGVYERLLRHRQAVRLDINVVLPVRASVYDALDAVTDLMPSPDEVAQVMAAVEARPPAEIEREVADWYRL